GPTGTGGNTAEPPKAWYESDVYLTAQATLDHGIELTSSWYEYYSPNAQFRTITEVDVGVAWNDGFLWNDAFKIHPSIPVARELRGQAEFNDSPTGTHPGTWLGVGVAPEFRLADCGDPRDEETSRPSTLAFPVVLDLSLDHYYEDADGDDETFGGLDVGAALHAPLPFLGEGLGQWSCDLGLHWLVLGDHMKEHNPGDATQRDLSP